MRFIVTASFAVLTLATSLWAVPSTNGWDTDVIYVIRGLDSTGTSDGEIRKLDENAPDVLHSDLGKFGADLPNDEKNKSLCFSNSPTAGANSPDGVRMWCVYNYPTETFDPTDFIVVEYNVNANLMRRFYGSAAIGAAVGNLNGPDGRVRVGTIRYNPAKNTIAVSVNLAVNDAGGGIVPGSQKGVVYEYELPDWPASTTYETPTLVQRYEMPPGHIIHGDNGNINSPLAIDFDDHGNMYATNKFFSADGDGYWGDVIKCNTVGLNGGLTTHVISITGPDAGNLIIDGEIENQLHPDYNSGGQAVAVRAQFNQLVLSPTIEPPTNIGIYDLTQRVGGGPTGNLIRLNTAYPSPRKAQFAQRDYHSGKVYIANWSGDGPPGNFRYIQNDYPTDTLVVDVGYFLNPPCEPKCEINKTWDAASPPLPISTGPTCFADKFDYNDGNLNGNGSWSGSATSRIQVVGETVKILGGSNVYDANVYCNCPDPGTGHIKIAVKIHSGIGGANMWSLWYDDPAGANLARWYGSGTTARGRIGGSNTLLTDYQSLTGDWDNLLVKIYPFANTSEFFFNDAHVGTLNHSITGALDVLGRIKFETMNNSAADGQYVFFDDLIVGEYVAPGDFDFDKDVDQEDFGHFQECYSGDGALYPIGCQDADLDGDRDVDQDDFNIFLVCMGGPNNPPGC
ncbi:MAG: hypothetical protein ACYTF1_01290 [Planctomycetota bacterium]